MSTCTSYVPTHIYIADMRTNCRPSFRKKGGELQAFIQIEGGVKPCVHVHKHMYTRGVWGHAPQEILVFRISETASGAFSGTL